MKYYDYTSNFELDPDLINKYIVERDSNNDVYKICFDDSQLDEYFKTTNANWTFDLGLSAYFIGEDGFFYEFMPDGTIKKNKECTDKFINQLWNSRLKIASKIKKDRLYWQKVLNSNNCQLNLISKSISGFDKYFFINASNDYLIPFRFKKAKKDNAPLLIYFHGAGCLGHDNFKPLFEYKSFLFGKKLPDCNILIPQASFGSNFLYSNTKDYINNCAELIKLLMNNYSVDKDRVYCFGTSFGGCCVWYSISMYPELFAAAVPAMGLMMHFKEFLPVLKKYSTMPIWIAHSSDDNNVNIAVDDYLYNELKNINPNLRYTRWDKFGHKMAGHFYRKEPFIDWMFKQSFDQKQ